MYPSVNKEAFIFDNSWNNSYIFKQKATLLYKYNPLGTAPELNFHLTFKIRLYVQSTFGWRLKFFLNVFECPADVQFRYCAQWEYT